MNFEDKTLWAIVALAAAFLITSTIDTRIEETESHTDVETECVGCPDLEKELPGEVYQLLQRGELDLP